MKQDYRKRHMTTTENLEVAHHLSNHLDEFHGVLVIREAWTAGIQLRTLLSAERPLLCQISYCNASILSQHVIN